MDFKRNFMDIVDDDIKRPVWPWLVFIAADTSFILMVLISFIFPEIITLGYFELAITVVILSIPLYLLYHWLWKTKINKK
jgi:hypothetical protein